MDKQKFKCDFAKVNGISLHYLDWGGTGNVPLFLTGMGNNAHVYDVFAPRFTDQFHVLGLTRRGHGDSDYPETGYDVDTLTEDLRLFMDSLHIEKAVLVGHSMANIELCRFSALHPERVEKLIFLDAAYDRTSENFKTMVAKNPMRTFKIPEPEGITDSIGKLIHYCKNNDSYWGVPGNWNEAMDEEALHNVGIGPDGKVEMKGSENIGIALNATLSSYKPEDSLIKVPVLSIYAILGVEEICLKHMTDEQITLLSEFYNVTRPPITRDCIAQFRRDVPHAKIVEISNAHHHIFIKHAAIVYEEMRAFLNNR